MEEVATETLLCSLFQAVKSHLTIKNYEILMTNLGLVCEGQRHSYGD